MAIENDSFASTDKNRMYREQIITKDDLFEFRKILLKDLKEILETKVQPQKQWLKSTEVRKILNISPSTLQTLRVNGTLKYTLIGTTFYYKYDDLNLLLKQ